MATVQKIRVFLSSPGDVGDERKRVEKIIQELNHQWVDVYDAEFDLIDWKIDVAPGMGRVQQLINDQVGDYDVYIGIMWKRFGSKTGVADSGTEEEFNLAFEKWQTIGEPRILFYFKTTPYTPKNREEIEQWGKVLDFKEAMQKKGLTADFADLDEFDSLLRAHLVIVLKSLIKPKKGAVPGADFSA